MNTKVQKKIEKTSISVLTMLEQENTKEVLLEILTDYVIFFRIERVMYNLYNVFNPSAKEGLEWEAEMQYSGYGSAMKVLNIFGEMELNNCLSNITYNIVSDNNNDAQIVADNILTIWDREIRKYFSTKNQ